MSCKK